MLNRTYDIKIWTPKEDADLIREWNTGKSARLLAAVFNRSRNAVIGRINRLRAKGVRLRTVDAPARSSLGGRQAALNKRDHAVIYAPAQKPPTRTRLRAHPLWTPAADVPLAPDAAYRVGLLSARDGQCRWLCSPPGDPGVYCGAPTLHGKSWCSHHAHLVFAPEQPKISQPRTGRR